MWELTQTDAEEKTERRECPSQLGARLERQQPGQLLKRSSHDGQLGGNSDRPCREAPRLCHIQWGRYHTQNVGISSSLVLLHALRGVGFMPDSHVAKT